ncbi:hypothetical protein BDN72DRAFT_837529 [Pluteus cervinus]|uniref:Uncharacterized protein n=1 Tax=Pluteus cervinus TaxID=181527 RepID=A0ACD3B0G4_9AGAR|nr:hypothetical protein BDN72DRAFT_837529 [Pluteus cervinus]
MAPWILFADIGLWSLGRFSSKWFDQPQTRIQTFIVDDHDDELQFKGSWVREVGLQTTFGSAFQNTLTGSRTVGDQMKVEFIGSSLGVYGATNPGSGKLAFDISLDDAPPVTHIQFDGTQNESSTWSISQELFYMNWGNDHPERHELTITVHEVTESQILWLDYITFESIDLTADLPLPSLSSNLASTPRDKRSVFWDFDGCGELPFEYFLAIILPILLVPILGILSLVCLPDCRSRPRAGARSTRSHQGRTIRSGLSNTPRLPFQQAFHSDDSPIPPPYTRESAMPEVAIPSESAGIPLAPIPRSPASYSGVVNDLQQQIEELRWENQRIRAELGYVDVSRPPLVR